MALGVVDIEAGVEVRGIGGGVDGGEGVEDGVVGRDDLEDVVIAEAVGGDGPAGLSPAGGGVEGEGAGEGIDADGIGAGGVVVAGDADVEGLPFGGDQAGPAHVVEAAGEEAGVGACEEEVARGVVDPDAGVEGGGADVGGVGPDGDEVGLVGGPVPVVGDGELEHVVVEGIVDDGVGGDAALAVDIEIDDNGRGALAEDLEEIGDGVAGEEGPLFECLDGEEGPWRVPVSTEERGDLRAGSVAEVPGSDPCTPMPSAHDRLQCLRTQRYPFQGMAGRGRGSVGVMRSRCSATGAPSLLLRDEAQPTDGKPMPTTGLASIPESCGARPVPTFPN